jgi:transposase
MQTTAVIVGVDVAQAELVTATHEPATTHPLPNRTEPIQRWLRTLPAGSTVAMEATGRYHRLLAQLAHAAGLRVFVLNPRDVYFYARAVSSRGKTDRLDAQVIARYAAEHHERLRPWQPPPPVTQALHELLGRRAMLVSQRVALRQSLRQVPALAEAAQQLQRAYACVIEEIDRQLEELVDTDEGLRRGVQRLGSITGFGPRGAIRLGALFTQTKFDNADAVVAYSGLDPRPCDSGARRGTRRLSKQGPAALRTQLYLAAFAASHSKALGPLYEQIKARGFASTQALVILARKLLRIAWAVWNSGQDFDPTRVGGLRACAKT